MIRMFYNVYNGRTCYNKLWKANWVGCKEEHIFRWVRNKNENQSD